MTGTAAIAVSIPISTTALIVFIVGRFPGEDAVTAAEGRRVPLHLRFHEAQRTVEMGVQRLEEPHG